MPVGSDASSSASDSVAAAVNGRSESAEVYDSRSAIFASGMVVMLLLPLLIAVCVARCYFHRSATTHHRLPNEPHSATKLINASIDSADDARSASENEDDGLQSCQHACRPPTAARVLTHKMRRHGSAAMRFERRKRSFIPVRFRNTTWTDQSHKPFATRLAVHTLTGDQQSLQVRLPTRTHRWCLSLTGCALT